MIRVLLADDHPIVRQGLRRLLEVEDGFVVIGEAGTGLEAMQLAERLKPDILVLDLMLPGLNGLEVTLQLSQRLPETHILILSMHSSDAYVIQALRNGAKGYILKDTGPNELVQAIRQVIAGRRYLSSRLSERLLDTFLSKSDEMVEDPYQQLTAREREVLQLAAEGYTNVEIGNMLSLSSRTVELHRANMMSKLGLHNSSELVRYAIRKGIITIES